MTLSELTTELQELCHHGHSLDFLVVNGQQVSNYNIEIRDDKVFIFFEN